MTGRQRVAAIYVGVLGVLLSGVGGMVLLASNDFGDFRYDIFVGWGLVVTGVTMIAAALLLALAHAPGLLYGIAITVGVPNMIGGVQLASRDPWPGLPLLLSIAGLAVAGMLVLPDLAERPVESSLVAMGAIALALFSIAPTGQVWGALLVGVLGTLPVLLRSTRIRLLRASQVVESDAGVSGLAGPLSRRHARGH